MVDSVRPERDRRPERPSPATQRQQNVGVAVAEPPSQDFRFTDYSMFAAEPEKVGRWAEPRRHTGSWRRAVLGIVVAVLFFVLGATVGRETVERWIADIGGLDAKTRSRRRRSLRRLCHRLRQRAPQRIIAKGRGRQTRTRREHKTAEIRPLDRPRIRQLRKCRTKKRRAEKHRRTRRTRKRMRVGVQGVRNPGTQWV